MDLSTSSHQVPDVFAFVQCFYQFLLFLWLIYCFHLGWRRQNTSALSLWCPNSMVNGIMDSSIRWAMRRNVILVAYFTPHSASEIEIEKKKMKMRLCRICFVGIVSRNNFAFYVDCEEVNDNNEWFVFCRIGHTQERRKHMSVRVLMRVCVDMIMLWKWEEWISCIEPKSHLNDTDSSLSTLFTEDLTLCPIISKHIMHGNTHARAHTLIYIYCGVSPLISNAVGYVYPWIYVRRARICLCKRMSYNWLWWKPECLGFSKTQSRTWALPLSLSAAHPSTRTNFSIIYIYYYKWNEQIANRWQTNKKKKHCTLIL